MSDRKLVLSVLLKGADMLSGPLRNIMGVSGGAQSALKKLTNTEKEQQDELKKLRSEMGALGVATQSQVERERTLQAQLDNTTRKVKAQKSALENTARAKRSGSEAKDKGMENITTGVGLAIPLFLAAKASSDFADGMTDVRLNAALSVDQTARLQANIISAAAAAKQLPSDMQKGMAALVAMGTKDDIASAMIAPIGKAATAYRANVEDLAKAGFAAVDNLKVPAGDTTRALEVMAAAGKAGKVELRDMAQYFPMLTGQAAVLGQKGVPAVADLSAALEIVAKNTGDASVAANNLQNLLLKLRGNETVKNFKAAGVDLLPMLDKLQAQGKSPIEAILEATRKATKGNASKINQLFTDQQAQQAVTALVGHIKEFQDVKSAALNSVGSLDADYAISAANASANYRALTGSIQSLAIVVGDKLLPALTPMIDKTAHIITAASDWAAANPGLSNAILTTVVAITAANLALGGARVLYGSVVGPITAVSNAYKILRASSAIGAVVSGANAMMAGGWAALTAASGPFIASMFSAAAAAWAVAWPILAVVAAVAAVVFAFTHWDQIVTYVSGVWGRLQKVLASIDWLKLGGNMLTGLVNGIMGGIPGLIIAIGKVALAGVGHFKKILGIHSPSRVFMAFGGHISEGLGLGIEGAMDHPLKRAAKLAAGVAGAGALALSAASPALAAAGPSGGGGGRPIIMQIAPGAIVIHAGPGQSPEDIARAIEDALSRHAEKAQAAARSAYRDDE